MGVAALTRKSHRPQYLKFIRTWVNWAKEQRILQVVPHPFQGSWNKYLWIDCVSCPIPRTPGLLHSAFALTAAVVKDLLDISFPRQKYPISQEGARQGTLILGEPLYLLSQKKLAAHTTDFGSAVNSIVTLWACFSCEMRDGMRALLVPSIHFLHVRHF